MSESDLTALKAANINVHASNTVALTKQATADKNDSRQSSEAMIRAEVWRIKARADYTEGQGAQLGIVGPERYISARSKYRFPVTLKYCKNT